MLFRYKPPNAANHPPRRAVGTAKLSITSTLARGRVDWLVRQRHNAERARSDANARRYPRRHEGHTAAPPRHPTPEVTRSATPRLARHARGQYGVIIAQGS